MNTNRLRVLLLVSLLYSFCNPTLARANDFPVSKGLVDLRNWDPQGTPTVSLNGEWKFYWNELLLHADLDHRLSAGYIQLSKPWSEQAISGETFSKNGFATYSLDVLLPKDVNEVSFSIPAVFNSYEFWVNDQLIASAGKPGTSAESMTPEWRPRSVDVAANTDVLHIIFRISNFQGTRGGCAEVMRIGRAGYLTQTWNTSYRSGMILTLVFLSAFVGCLIFSINSKRKPVLYLGLLSGAYVLRFLFSDLYLYNEVGLPLSWILVARVEYITIPLISITGTLFISSIYPNDFRKTIKYFFLIVNFALMIATLILPSSVFSQLLIYSQVVGLLLVSIVISVIIKALIHHRIGASLTMWGIVVLSLVAFYNIYAFLSFSDLSRVIVHGGYFAALMLNFISLFYRTSQQLLSESGKVRVG